MSHVGDCRNVVSGAGPEAGGRLAQRPNPDSMASSALKQASLVNIWKDIKLKVVPPRLPPSRLSRNPKPTPSSPYSISMRLQIRQALMHH